MHHLSICSQCGYGHSSDTCVTDDEVVAWFDSQSEEFLAALPGYEDGLTPRRAWNEFFSSSPATETAPASSPAPGVAGQGEGTNLVKGFPTPADCLDQLGRVIREPLVLKQFGLIAKTGDCQFPVLAGDALQLLADEFANKRRCVDGNDSSLLEGGNCCLIDRVLGFYGRSFVLLIHVLSSDGKDGYYSTGGQGA